MPDTTVITCCWVRPEKDADIPLPRYMTPHSAGMDICAAVEQPAALAPGEIILVPTGFAISLPEGASFTAKLDTVSGNLSCAFPGTLGSDLVVVGDGDATYRFNTVSGSVRIEKN